MMRAIKSGEDKSPRILYVIGSMEVGGAERHVTRLAVRLKERGWEPELFAMSPAGPLAEVLLQAGVPIHGIVLPRWFSNLLFNDRLRARVALAYTAAKFLLTLWRRRPEIVHFFLPAAYIVGGVTSLAGPPMLRIMSRRSLNHYQAKHRLFRRIEHWLHPRMDLVCGNSSAVIRDLQSEGVRADQLRLIYNGIDTNSFRAERSRAAVRKELGIDEDAVMLVMVANLIPYKGHADLIQALSHANGALPARWVCVCVGRDDGIGSALSSQARAAGIDDHFRFTGSRKDVPDLLEAADIGVLCSHEEGFSNAIIEGMVSALPMVVTDVGGNAEAVVHGETGLVVPARDPQALGRALLLLCQDQSLRSRMGEAGRERARSQFSMDACVAAYEALYRQELPPVANH